MYEIVSILNYNGTHRLDGNYPDRIGVRCVLYSDLERGFCLKVLVDDEQGHSFITSPVKDYRGTPEKTDLTVYTADTIFEFKLIKDGE